MLCAATYSNGRETLRVSVEKTEVLLKSQEILNFPRLIGLEGDRLVLPYGRGRHGGRESRPVAFSQDGGKTWADISPDAPMADNVQTSGILGYLSDGTVAYVDVFPQEALGWNREVHGAYHSAPEMMIADPTFRFRRFSRKDGSLVEQSWLKLVDVPWERASYELYGTLLELENGDYLTAFQCQLPQPDYKRFNSTTFIGRSSDRGRTFRHVWTFVPELEGKPVGDEGFCEPDLAVLANGDILCIMRTGSRSPLYQSRSTDGGLTWSTPVSTGWPAAKPDLTLLSNGVLVCSSGRGVYGRPQVTHVMFSIDGTGEVWEPPFIFHTGPGCSYTSNMERDGKLCIVYSDSSFTKPVETYDLPYQSIKWVVLNVSKETAASPELASRSAEMVTGA